MHRANHIGRPVRTPRRNRREPDTGRREPELLRLRLPRLTVHRPFFAPVRVVRRHHPFLSVNVTANQRMMREHGDCTGEQHPADEAEWYPDGKSANHDVVSIMWWVAVRTVAGSGSMSVWPVSSLNQSTTR